jgi:hypothetical protein
MRFEATNSNIHRQRIDTPREGTKTRILLDLFKSRPGIPFEFKIAGSGDARRMSDLRDYYGMDIRCLQHGNRRTSRPSIWVLAGEWVNDTYVDYIAERIK